MIVAAMTTPLLRVGKASTVSSSQRLASVLLDCQRRRGFGRGLDGTQMSESSLLSASEDFHVTGPAVDPEKFLKNRNVSAQQWHDSILVERTLVSAWSDVGKWSRLQSNKRLQSNERTGFRFYSGAEEFPAAGGAQRPPAVDYSSVLEEEDFHDLADNVLHRLQEKIEVYGEDLNVDGFDLDHASGVLTVRLGELGTYVINKQTPNRQIWLSSPVSGPGRFDWSKSKSSWIYRRANVELVSLLEKELSTLLRSDISLS